MSVASDLPVLPPEALEPQLARSLRRHLAAGLLAFIALFGGAGAWALWTEFAGAVIAPGQMVVDTSAKKIQHPTGGVVGEIRVRDGDRVKAGDIVLRLDETITRANLAIVTKGLAELRARLARLEAERDGAASVTFPPDLGAGDASVEPERILAGETSLFTLRAAAREGQKAQLTERIAQLREEIGGLENQITAKGEELRLIFQELVGVQKLYAQNLVSVQRLSALEREAARLKGEQGQLIASTAQARGKISETKLQVLQIDQDLRSEVARDIREAQGKIAELVERKATAEDQLKRVDLRAPQDGTVHQLAVHTVGGVINPAEAVMMIVPNGDDLTIEVRISPHDIEGVRPNQPARLRFTAFNQRTTPEVDGKVLTVSPDVSVDQRTGGTFYTARLGLAPGALASLGVPRLLPGMPVEAYIETPLRTVISYLTRPLSDQVRRAFRER